MVETFLEAIEADLIWPTAWQSRQQSENAIARYIDGFYNPVRRHSSLGFQIPIAFERKAEEVGLTPSTKAGQVQTIPRGSFSRRLRDEPLNGEIAARMCMNVGAIRTILSASRACHCMQLQPGRRLDRGDPGNRRDPPLSAG